MRISVFGLGYVGCVSAVCLASEGHEVVGVDIDKRKVDIINEGKAPFAEPGLEQLLQTVTNSGALTATTSEREAIEATDIALVCVGTPSARSGEVRLEYLSTVFVSIGKALRSRSTPFIVILRSTVLPNIVEETLLPLMENAAGTQHGDRLQLCYNPEFLREGSALHDYYEAPMVIIGQNSEWAAQIVEELYRNVRAPFFHTDIRTACLVKYVCNTFHALKVSFANEIGQLCDSLNADGRRVMEVVCADTKLNISPKYLTPGFAFGGSCLPKDLRAIVAQARIRGLFLPVIQGILPSNKAHLQNCIDAVIDTGERTIGLFGLAFKENTDDLRESPAVELAEALIGKGLEIMIYEPSIMRGNIFGANLSYIEATIPHIWKLLTPDLESMTNKSKAIVLMRKANEHEKSILSHLRDDQVCVDFVNTIEASHLAARLIPFATPSKEEVLQ